MTNVHQLTTDLSKGVKTEDITPIQYKILEYIMISQSVTITEISDCLHMSLPNTSRELRKLVEKDLCEKLPDTTDRRKYYIQLTDKGNLMMQEAFRKIQLEFEQRIKDLSEEELKEIDRAVDVLQSKVFY
jgi:DNA-binding MarR family transcriptional regulator